MTTAIDSTIRSRAEGWGAQISVESCSSNRMGLHAHKIFCGRTIDFFKQQSKKSNEIAGATPERDGVGGLNRWLAWQGWNPRSHPQIFFPPIRIFRAQFELNSFFRPTADSERRVKSATSSMPLQRLLLGAHQNRAFIFQARVEAGIDQKKCREIRGGGEGCSRPYSRHV